MRAKFCVEWSLVHALVYYKCIKSKNWSGVYKAIQNTRNFLSELEAEEHLFQTLWDIKTAHLSAIPLCFLPVHTSFYVNICQYPVLRSTDLIPQDGEPKDLLIS